MNIGTISNQNGTLVGRIATLAASMTVALRPIQSNNERAPKFDVLALANNKAWIVVGALFELTSNSTGEAFLQGKIDDPSLAAPLNIALFRQQDGSYNVVWNRPRRARDVPAASRQSGDLPPLPGGEPQAEDTSGDGLGQSTAEFANS